MANSGERTRLACWSRGARASCPHVSASCRREHTATETLATVKGKSNRKHDTLDESLSRGRRQDAGDCGQDARAPLLRTHFFHMTHPAQFLRCVALLILAFGATVAVSAATARFSPELNFAADGKPSLLTLLEDRANLVVAEQPGKGFYLTLFDGNSVREVPLDRVTMRDDALIASTEAGLPRFTFDLTRGNGYLALKLKRVEGVPNTGALSLHFEINCRLGIRVLPLDYMIDAHLHGPTTVTAHWRYLWHKNPDDPLGGFALYLGDTDEASDEALRQVWAAEDLPRPRIAEAWTPERIRKWVNDYRTRFSDLTTMIVSAKSPDELRRLTDYAQRAGAKVVYLHTDTWRGEYWPVKRSHVDVNPDVFPGGRSDLKRYADDLHQRGMLLLLHYVSAGIGNADPKRVVGHVDRNLASWGRGRLERAIDEKDREIRFVPDPGVRLPIATREPCIMGAVGDFMKFNILRIDDEIVEAGRMEDLDKPVWVLRDCRRGRYGASISSHAAGADAAGLYSAYGQNYIPDVDSPLLDEMAREYATFANEIGLDHLEYDGYEINQQFPWGAAKFSDRVARLLDHGVTSNTSGGRPVASNLEMLFSSVRKLNQFGYHSANLSLLLEGHRPATSMLDANFELQAGVARGTRRFQIVKPEPMFGVSAETLRTHGLVEPMMAAFRNWKQAAQTMTDAQLAELAKTVEPIRNRLGQAGNHVQGKDVYCIGARNGVLEMTPTRVMVRSQGDVPWRIGQEFGPVGPRQYCQPGDVLQLENPFAAQQAGFIIHVLADLGSTASLSGSGVASHAADAVLESYRTGADAARQGNTVVTGTVASLASIQPAASEIQGQRHTSFKQEGAALVMSADNPTGEDRWVEEGLPGWRKPFSMEATRAIGMDLTGDGSGAVLVLQVKGRGVRDYVVKVDFVGKKSVVIPNGEVAWADGCWGWRFSAKYLSYGKMGGIDLGFGFVPARSHPRVKIENLRLLSERPSRLVNPMICTGGGRLRVAGEIETGQYLQYEGGDTATVYDGNWNKLKQLSVTLSDYTMPSGFAPVRVQVQDGSPRPWLDVRFIAKGSPILIQPTKVH